MIKIDRRYTIKFSKNGIYQYAVFYEKDGKLVNPSLMIQYSKVSEIPSVENLETIEEVLKVIKAVSFCNRAEIHLIDGFPVNYFNNKEARESISNFKNNFDKFIEIEAVKFFEEVLEPIMKKNEWFISTSHIGMPILIEKNEEGEWDNIKRGNDFDFEYLCYRFVSNIPNDVKIELNSESSNNSIYDAFNCFLNCLPETYFVDKKIFIEV